MLYDSIKAELGVKESTLSNATDGTASIYNIVPKSSTVSYDGRQHHIHKEVPSRDVNDALHKLAENDVDLEDDPALKTPVGRVMEQRSTGCGFAYPRYKDAKTLEAIKKKPNRRDFLGYFYSRQTPRPFALRSFFLPIIPQPAPRKHITVNTSGVPAEAVKLSLSNASKGLMPLSTVHIKWRAGTTRSNFNPYSLYIYLSRFGSIESIYQKSPNSILVIFCEISSAQACVKCPDLGLPWDKLISSWWEPRMHNHGYAIKHLRLEEHTIQLDMDGPFLKNHRPADK